MKTGRNLSLTLRQVINEEMAPPKTLRERIGRTIDQWMMAIAPRAGVRRMQARWAGKILNASYRGAEKNRLRKDWSPLGGSADADLLPDLPTLRERSRDLNRNDAHAAAITGTVVVNVVGSGIRPQSRVDRTALGITDDEARAYERAVERAWRRWMPHADSQGRADFYELESLIQRQILENGEVLVLPLMIKDEPWRPYRLALEVIEADRLETPPGKRGDATIRDGVELGERGQPVAYWIRKRHPGDLLLGRAIARTDLDYIRYPARNSAGRPNVLHLYWKKRPGQTRGEPFFAPVMTAFKDLGDYLEAEIVAARVAACFAVFIKKTDALGAVTNATTVESGQRIEELEPGIIDYLLPGEEVQTAIPQRAGGTFEPFVLAVLRSMCAALGLPLLLVLKDFSKVNYSSARAALLEARRFFRSYQQWLACRFCQPVWEMLLEEAWLKAELPGVNLFGPEREDWLRARWIAPGWGWVDPVKEVQASKLAVQSGISTLADENAAQGRDWEETRDQQKTERDSYAALGMPYPADAPTTNQAGELAPNGGGQETETETEETYA
jgi:lambda family phage portal protein